MRDLLAAYQHAVASEIIRWQGHVARFMGDGVLACFGWPRAHEDEGERAIRAGLAVVESVHSVKIPQGINLSARVGIATGLVVVGDLIGEGPALEEGVIGATPNLAARLQQLAPPGAVVIAESTRHLLAGVFSGRRPSKGSKVQSVLSRCSARELQRAVSRRGTAQS
jgi:class 3 adenylate cyclase